MRQAYLDYSMSVIVARALPDVRDGLKPVQRRILYTMHEMGLRNDRPFRKSAAIVGDVMGKYHPHGDVPIYDALVRLAQDFAARYPLVQGQGNFGCFTGDTKVELYSGEQKTFTELVEMAHKGMRAEIFTVDAHRNVRIKPLRAPRLVRRNDPVVKLTLESGAEILCTPDHRFMLRDGTYREAQQLKAKDQLMPFSRTAIPERLHRTGAFPIPASLTAKVAKVEPAGRADVYDLTVDVTQNFALAAGVFAHNSIDDDPPAHMRYTEARLAAISNEMLADIEKATVDWMPNYDNRHQQPTVLPARLPNLIVNGSAGIAVGMATNIPPHNLREIAEATKRLIDDPDLTTDDLCETVLGPDFPGGGVIYRYEEQRNVETGAAERVDAIRRAYAQGRGRVIVRAKAHNEQLRGNRDAIIVTELPYAVNKASLIEKIAELVQAKRLAGISDIRDESDREGMRVVIEVKRDDDPTLVLNNLYKHTAMQSAFNLNMLALVDQHPRTLALKEILQHHIDHRREGIPRRTQHDLGRAKERAHILQGLKIAHDHIHEIIKLIRAHKGQEPPLLRKRRRGRRDPHPEPQLREADAALDLSRPAPRGQGRHRDGHAGGGRRRASRRRPHPRSPLRVHRPRAGVRTEGLRAARREPHREGHANPEHPRGDAVGRARLGARRSPRHDVRRAPRHGDAQGLREEDAAQRICERPARGTHRDRAAKERSARLGRAMRQAGPHHPRDAERQGDHVQGDRRAAHGTADAGRDRDPAPEGRRGGGNGHRSPPHPGPLGDGERVREADHRRELPATGPRGPGRDSRRARHEDRQRRRHPDRRRGDAGDPVDQHDRRRHPHAARAGARSGPRDDGCQSDGHRRRDDRLDRDVHADAAVPDRARDPRPLVARARSLVT